MLNLLNNIVLYRYNDMAYMFLLNMNRFQHTNWLEPTNVSVGDNLTRSLITFWSFHIPPILLNNIFVILSLSLSLIFAFVLFRELTNEKLLAVVFSLIYAICPFYLFRIMSATVALYFICVFPLLFYLLIKGVSSQWIAIYLVLVTTVCTYYAFFCYAILAVWMVHDVIVYKKLPKVYDSLKPVFISVISIIIIFGGSLFYHIPIFGHYTQTVSLYRPLDDFYNFSIKPWDLIMPPPSSIFFGEVRSETLRTLGVPTRYIEDGYNENEVGGAYLGWSLIIGFIVSSSIVFVKLPNKLFPTISKTRGLLLKLLIIGFVVLLVSLPPSFNVLGIKIFAPSYAQYHLLPMFRVLTRWSIVLFLIVLIFNAVLLKDVINLISHKYVKYYVLIVFFLATEMFLMVKITTIEVNNPPADIKFIKDFKKEDFNYAEYPNGSFYSIFWGIYHQKFLVNPKDLNKNRETSSVEDFEKIISEDKVSLLAFYPARISDSREVTELKTQLQNTFGKPVVHGEALFYILDQKK